MATVPGLNPVGSSGRTRVPHQGAPLSQRCKLIPPTLRVVSASSVVAILGAATDARSANAAPAAASISGPRIKGCDVAMAVPSSLGRAPLRKLADMLDTCEHGKLPVGVLSDDISNRIPGRPVY